jgi:hypothetical protein
VSERVHLAVAGLAQLGLALAGSAVFKAHGDATRGPLSCFREAPSLSSWLSLLDLLAAAGRSHRGRILALHAYAGDSVC